MLVAVETDGPGYAAMPSTRDRDRLRIEQLRRLGWQHTRVWTTDLFRDPARDVSRVAGLVRAASDAQRGGAPMPESTATPHPGQSPTATTEPAHDATTVEPPAPSDVAQEPVEGTVGAEPTRVADGSAAEGAGSSDGQTPSRGVDDGRTGERGGQGRAGGAEHRRHRRRMGASAPTTASTTTGCASSDRRTGAEPRSNGG